MTTEPTQVDSHAFLGKKLAELDVLEEKIETLRPRNQIRGKVLILFLLAVAIVAGMAVSSDPSLLGASAFGIAALSAFSTWIAIISRRHKLKALEWQRDKIFAEIGQDSGEGKAHPLT